MADIIMSGILLRVTKASFLDGASVGTVDQRTHQRWLKKMDQSKTQYVTFTHQIVKNNKILLHILLSFVLTLSRMSPTEKSVILFNVRMRLSWSSVAKTSEVTRDDTSESEEGNRVTCLLSNVNKTSCNKFVLNIVSHRQR